MPYKDPEVRKQKHREYSRKHYEANKGAVIAKTATRKKSVRKQWIALKESVKCISCGFAHPAAIDFHHVNPSPSDRKIFALLRRNNFSAALEEIKRCVPLCANCHRVHHYDERVIKRKQRKKKNPAF
jgi:predicted HNH restriction endonuclease